MTTLFSGDLNHDLGVLLVQLCVCFALKIAKIPFPQPLIGNHCHAVMIFCDFRCGSHSSAQIAGEDDIEMCVLQGICCGLSLCDPRIIQRGIGLSLQSACFIGDSLTVTHHGKFGTTHSFKKGGRIFCRRIV